MGLAASQARFLGLTARKSNVEYRGQQINQARTALSNEVAGLYDKYNKLNVPVPPSKQDFVKTKYVLNETEEKYAITNFSKITSGDYKGYYNVTLEYDEDVPNIYPYTAKDTILTVDKNDDNTYNYINFKFGKEDFLYDANNPNLSTITKIVVENIDDEIVNKYQGLRAVMEKYEKTSGTYYMFTRDNKPYYTSEDDLNDIDEDNFVTGEDENGEPLNDKKTYYGDYAFDFLGLMHKESNASAIATLTQASTGRLTTIQIIETEDEDLKPMIGYTYSITTTTEDDEIGYNDAMNQYNYDKAVYEKQVETINKKTEQLQKQDRTLELQLNQLDTEQNALATEMESVTKVIEDTIKSVFGTYDG